MDHSADIVFTRALPKAELHAHLSGSISRNCLYAIWTQKQQKGECLDIEDPSIALSLDDDCPTIEPFFQLFNKYIYRLCDDAETIRQATLSVVEDFEHDGVAYLELRTTPRALPSKGISRDYVLVVLEALRDYQENHPITDQDDCPGIEVQVLLSIDRNMTPEEAMEIVSIGERFGAGRALRRQHPNSSYVIGIDLCGNPAAGDVSNFTRAFQQAQISNLRTVVHFAEIPQSSTRAELETILSWYPERLGHFIHVPEDLQAIVMQRLIGLELCPSCNVLANMIDGSFADHHFGVWHKRQNPVALSTDDVGIFDSPLSNEYLLAAKHFDLDRKDLVSLSRRAVQAAFSGKQRMKTLLDAFEASHTDVK